MNSSELLAAFRDDVDDNELPVFWSDAEVFRYMDDAQKMFCRLTGGLGDGSTPAVTQLTVTAGDTWANTHPAILKTRSAYLDADGSPLQIVNLEDLQQRGMRFDGRTGPLKALVIGIEKHKVRLYPVPALDAVVQLIVDRLPLTKITDVGDQEFEIDEQHHEPLLAWMKAQAYGKQDAETFDKSKADKYEAWFRAYCMAAKREKERAMHKTRVVAYGGI
jgi:hypothetical protein